jgi:hypothetical protein
MNAKYKVGDLVEYMGDEVGRPIFALPPPPLDVKLAAPVWYEATVSEVYTGATGPMGTYGSTVGLYIDRFREVFWASQDTKAIRLKLPAPLGDQIRCECGAEKTYGSGSELHSTWCPKHGDRQ